MSASPVLAGSAASVGDVPRLLLRLGTPAVVDHGIAAATQLSMHLLLARWLPPSEYGAFVVGNAVFLVGLAVHSAFLAEPVLVFARRDFSERRGAYFGALILWHAALCSLLGTALAVQAWGLAALGSFDTARAFAAFAWASPLILVFTLVRRLNYASLAPAKAIHGGVIRAAVLVGGLAALHHTGDLSAPSAVACLAAGSIAGAIWIALRSDIPWRFPDRRLLANVLHRHGSYGRWSLPSVLLTWMPWNLHFVVLAGSWSLEEIAALRALYNVTLPISHLLMSLSAILLPIYSQGLSASSKNGMPAGGLGIGALFLALATGYFLFILVAGTPLLAWAYGGRYAVMYALAPWVAAVPIAVAGIMIIALLHRAARRTDKACLTWLPYGLLSLPLGWMGALLLGSAGLVAGIALASVLGLGWAVMGLRSKMPKRPAWEISP